MMPLPAVLPPRLVGPATHAMTTLLPVPGLGVLPVNAFLIRAAEPVLIDAGVAALADLAFEQLVSLIEPDDLRWIWLTHTDQDHIGCVSRLLQQAPKARIVTTYLGMGKLGLSMPVPPERVYLLNPGQGLDVGDRALQALRPPSFDAPETTAVFDPKTRTLFSADCFGAILDSTFESAQQIDRAELSAGLGIWGQVDAPWLSWISDAAFERSVQELRHLKPERVLSSHLPPAESMLNPLIEMLDETRRAAPFVGPDQQALIAMMTAA